VPIHESDSDIHAPVAELPREGLRMSGQEKRRPRRSAQKGQPDDILRMARLKALADREDALRCHAHNKNGQPCGNLAVRVGVCWAHGAGTPGAGTPGRPHWHRITPTTSVAKADRKVRTLERRRKRLAARLTAMTPEELAAYRKHSQAMRPGTPAERAQRRADRALRETLARNDDHEREPSAELLAIEGEIRRLTARLAGLQQEGICDD